MMMAVIILRIFGKIDLQNHPNWKIYNEEQPFEPKIYVHHSNAQAD